MSLINIWLQLFLSFFGVPLWIKMGWSWFSSSFTNIYCVAVIFGNQWNHGGISFCQGGKGFQELQIHINHTHNSLRYIELFFHSLRKIRDGFIFLRKRSIYDHQNCDIMEFVNQKTYQLKGFYCLNQAVKSVLIEPFCYIFIRQSFNTIHWNFKIQQLP